LASARMNVRSTVSQGLAICRSDLPGAAAHASSWAAQLVAVGDEDGEVDVPVVSTVPLTDPVTEMEAEGLPLAETDPDGPTVPDGEPEPGDELAEPDAEVVKGK
jgi:hypothetical protein